MIVTKYRVIFDNGHTEFTTLAAAQNHAAINNRPEPVEITEDVPDPEQPEG